MTLTIAGHAGIEWETVSASESTPEFGASIEPRFKTLNAVDLAAREFPELQYLVPGVIPTGMTLLVAPPKFGKSWLALHLAEACSSGGLTFGHIQTGVRPVLYLALEDSPRRLQKRMRHMRLEPNSNLEFATELQGLPLTGILREWLNRYRDQAPLVILDTLGKVMPAQSSAGSQYRHEYRLTSALKECVDEHDNASLIAVHHTRKQVSDDFIDSVSGTQGIAGAVDTIIVLSRERGSDRATMSVTSRDVEEADYSIRFSDDCKWTLDGSSIDEAKDAAARARVTEKLGEVMSEMITIISEHPDGISPTALKGLMPEHAAKVDVYLKRAVDAERVFRIERGLYALTPPVRSVSVSVSPVETPAESYKLTELTHTTGSAEEPESLGVSTPAKLKPLCTTHGTPLFEGDCGRCRAEEVPA